MKKQRCTALALALVLLAAVASPGCGGDSEQSTAEGFQVLSSTTVTVANPPLTKPQFVARINKVCREAWATVRDNWDVYTNTQSPKLSEKERLTEAVKLSLLAGIDFHIFDNIRILGSPAGEKQEIEEIIGPFQEAVELGQVERWRAYSLAEIPGQFSQYNRLAGSYGLDDCLVDEAHLEAADLSVPSFRR